MRDRIDAALASEKGRAALARGRDRAKTWIGVSDVRLLMIVLLLIYALFVTISVVLGLSFNGTVDTLRRITFLSAVFAMLTLALNVQWGYAGLFNIGVAGFMAIGVYTMAMLAGSPTGSPPGLGLPLPVAIVGGVLAAALIGTVAALPALRLRGDYLAIVTLAFSEIIRLTYRSPFFADSIPPIKFSGETIISEIAVGTGGSNGLSLPTNPIRLVFYESMEVGAEPSPIGQFLFDFFGQYGIRQTVVIGWAWVLVLVVFVGAFYWLLRRVGKSPFGRVLKAIREDQLVASALGKDTRWFKIKVFALGCALMGLAAILWKLDPFAGYTSPTAYEPIWTFYVFVALIIGGSGSTTGSVVGGAVFASLLFEGPRFAVDVVNHLFEFGRAPETFTQAVTALGGTGLEPLLAYTITNIDPLRNVILGVVLIYLIQNRPEGLLGHRTEVASSVDLSERGEDR